MALLPARLAADAAPGDLVTPAKKLHANLGALRHRAGFGGGTWQHDCLRHYILCPPPPAKKRSPTRFPGQGLGIYLSNSRVR